MTIQSPQSSQQQRLPWPPWNPTAVNLWLLAIAVALGIASETWVVLAISSVIAAVAINGYLFVFRVVPHCRNHGHPEKIGPMGVSMIFASVFDMVKIFVVASVSRIVAGWFS